MLTKADILKPRPKAPVEIVTTELGQGYIKRFTGADYVAWNEFVKNATDDKGNIAYVDLYHARLVQMTYCDADGKLMFEVNDVPTIAATLDFATMAQIFLEAARVNCLTRFDTIAEVARARENFSKTQTTATGTGSAGKPEN